MRAGPALLVAVAACGGGEQQPPPFDAVQPPGVDAAPDTTGPTVVFHSPELGATDVSATVSILVVFDEPIADSSVSPSSFVVTDPAGATPPMAITVAGDAVQLAAENALVPGARYEVVVTSAVTDLAGNHLQTEVDWSFVVAAGPDTDAPQIIYLSPAPAEQDVPLTIDVRVFFDEVIDPATVTAATVELTTGGDVEPTTLATETTGIVMTPGQPLAPLTTYRGTVTTGVADLAGNHLETTRQWSFTTVQSSPWTPAAVIEPFSQGIGTRRLAKGPAGRLALPALLADSPELLRGYVGVRDPTGVWSWTPIPDDTPRPWSIDGGMDDTGRTHVVWRRFSLADTPSGLYAAAMDTAGTWSAVAELDPSGATPAVHVAGTGAVIVAWRGNDGLNPAVKVRRHTLASGWLPTETISNSLPGGLDPMCVWIDDTGERAMVVWYAVSGTTEQVRAISRDATGWGAPVTLGTSTNQRQPELALNDSGVGMVVWSDLVSAVGYSAMIRRYDGSTWSAPEVLDTASAAGEDPHVAVAADGTAIASWTRYPSGSHHFVATRRWSGTAWSAVKTFEAADESEGSAVAIDPGGAGVVAYEWRDLATNAYEVHVARYSPSAGWGPSYQLDDTALAVGDSNAILAAISSTGVPIVIWRRAWFTNESLYASAIE